MSAEGKEKYLNLIQNLNAALEIAATASRTEAWGMSFEHASVILDDLAKKGIDEQVDELLNKITGTNKTKIIYSGINPHN